MVYNPYRYPDHFVVDRYVEAGWDRTDATQYLDAIMKSLNGLNPVMDLRTQHTRAGGAGYFELYVTRFMEYYQAMEEEGADEEAILEDTIKALDSDLRGWIATHDNTTESGLHWIGSVEKIYRESLNLPRRSEPMSQTVTSLDGIRWFGWLLATLIVVSSIGFAVWTVTYREKRIVKASQPLFLLLIDAGAFIMVSNNICKFAVYP